MIVIVLSWLITLSTDSLKLSLITKSLSISQLNSLEPRMPTLICQLYSDVMSTYGDHGNVIYLKYFLNSFGIQAELVFHCYGQPIPEAHIYIFGGGQDQAQQLVAHD